MPPQRGYRQGCGIARGLDLVGERWALLIVRELLLGPKRFTDLRTALPTASPNALTDRLGELADAGVLRRRRLPRPAASWVYELTEWGRNLEPILVDLGVWALGSAARDEQRFVSLDSLMLCIRTFFADPDTTNDATDEATLTIRLREAGRENAFGVRLVGGRAKVRHEPPPCPDAVITTDTEVLLNVLADHSRYADALGTTLTVEGDPIIAARFIRGVAIPKPQSLDAKTPERWKRREPPPPE